MEDLPTDILYRIGKHIDSRKLLLNLNLKNIFLPYIRDNYIYDYDTVRNNLDYFTDKYPKIYSGIHELTDKTIELLENCDTVYNFSVVSNKVTIKNTKIKNMYRSKGNYRNIIDYPDSLELLFTQEYTENIPNSIKNLYISSFSMLDIRHFNIYRSLEHLSITGGGVFRNLDGYDAPPSLTSINLGLSYSGSVKKILSNNIKYLTTGVIYADDLEYLSKNVIYLKGFYFEGDLPEFPYFPCLEYLRINRLRNKHCKLHFNKLSEKLKTFICYDKFSMGRPFPKHLENLSCNLNKDLSYLTNLRSLTLKANHSNDFIPNNKLFPKTILKSLNILHSLESFYLTVPDGVKYLYLLDYTINIKYPNSLERIDIRDSIHRDIYMTFPVSVKTLRFNRTHNEYEPIIDSYEYYDIPPTIDTIEFVANMDTTNHYKKFPNTIKKIIYNVLKKSKCEYFYLEIKNKIIIQYAYIPKLL